MVDRRRGLAAAACTLPAAAAAEPHYFICALCSFQLSALCSPCALCQHPVSSLLAVGSDMERRDRQAVARAGRVAVAQPDAEQGMHVAGWCLRRICVMHIGISLPIGWEGDHSLAHSGAGCRHLRVGRCRRSVSPRRQQEAARGPREAGLRCSHRPWAFMGELLAPGCCLPGHKMRGRAVASPHRSTTLKSPEIPSPAIVPMHA